MPQRDISFETSDGVTLRGWLFTPSGLATSRLPCLIMSHGWCALKEMDLNAFANHFTLKLPLACLVYDHRGFGDSDHKEGQPRQEIVPALQRSDMSDAITYAQSLPEVEPTKIGVWGTSYSGGHALFVGAVDRRVKAVLSQAPQTDGWQNFHRLIRPDVINQMNAMFEQDRIARAAGEKATVIPVAAEDPSTPSALPTSDSWKYISKWQAKSALKNEVTIRSIELMRGNDPSHMVHRISPTPLLMVVADNDDICPTDIALATYAKAREPKELHILPGGHFDAYNGLFFKHNVGVQVAFLRKTLCAE